MKRILLTLAILFIGFNSYSQLKLDDNWVHTNIDSVIQKIVDNNKNVDRLVKLPKYTFDDDYEAKFIILLDKNSNFLGCVFVNKKETYNGYPSTLYGVVSTNLYIFDYETKRKYDDFTIGDDNRYDIMFDDGSKITIIYDYEGRYRAYSNDSNTSKNFSYNKY